MVKVVALDQYRGNAEVTAGWRQPAYNALITYDVYVNVNSK